MPASSAHKVIDLSHLGLLQVSGAGAKQLLQGQLTCDLNDITETESRLGAHCNPQGRIISLFRLFFFQDNYYLQMPIDLLPIALAALQKYAVFFKVKLLDASSVLRRVCCHEAQLTQINLPTRIDEVVQLNNALIIKVPGTSPTYQIIGEEQALANLGINTNSTDTLNDWKYTTITAGIPSVYAKTSGLFLPHELNLQLLNSISFNKGCFTGQEIIARMQYRGQLKKHLYGATIKTTALPQPGDDIYSDSPCGTLVDCCRENEETLQVLVVANEADVQTQQLFLDPAKLEPVEFITLSSGGAHV